MLRLYMIDPEPPTLLNPLQCKYCSDMYCRNDALSRHMKICKKNILLQSYIASLKIFFSIR